MDHVIGVFAVTSEKMSFIYHLKFLLRAFSQWSKISVYYSFSSISQLTNGKANQFICTQLTLHMRQFAFYLFVYALISYPAVVVNCWHPINVSGKLVSELARKNKKIRTQKF